MSVDGSFGTATRDAVVAFQTRNQLTSDGIVGPDTWLVN
ncbi:peptidoglycan-binding protein [Streptomyces sp. NPDC001480]